MCGPLLRALCPFEKAFLSLIVRSLFGPQNPALGARGSNHILVGTCSQLIDMDFVLPTFAWRWGLLPS